MINFNGADEQKEFGHGPIPQGSFVKVKMEVKEPSEKKKSNIDPALTVSKSDNNNHYLDCEFSVVAGTYANVKIWQKFIVVGNKKASDISMSILRAILESVRGIDPKDASPAATQARQLNNWKEFNGMEFPIVTGIQKPKAGDLFINNTISRVVTPDKPEYQEIMNGGEKISDTPIPKIPDSPQNNAQNSTPAWGANNSNSAQETQKTPETKNDNVPAWAQ